MAFDSALPATVTAVHVALAVWRRHRAGPRSALGPFVLPSFLFVATPWIWPAPAGLAGAVFAHMAWVALCERLAPSRPARSAARPAPTSRPAVAPGAPTRPATRAVPAPSASPRSEPASAGFVRAPVLAVLEETPEIRTFRLARPEGFDFAAGQFIAVRVQIDGRPHVRCYSLSSPPEARGYLEISVRRQGLVSSMLHELLRPGATLLIGRPAGAFTYPASDDRPLGLLAGGIGITPLLSMLRHAVACDPARPVTLLYSARREHDVAFAAELRLLAARYPQVRISVTLSKPDRESRWRTGRIDADLVRQHFANPLQTIFCLCGPADMIRDVSAMLTSSGVPSGQVRSERFDTAIAAANLPVTRAAAPVSAAASRGADRRCRVSFASSGRETECDLDRTLLDAAESAGVAIASSCRAGVCQSCRTRLVDGEADCRSDMLDPEDRAAGFILPCVSWPTADCVLDA
jgi:ferredoxin-NADP reductase